MLTNIIRIAAVFFILFALAACELEHSDNGDIDGYWHLESIDSLTTGGHQDVSEQLLFWAVQGNLLEVSDQNNTYLFSFTYESGTLTLKEPRYDSRSEGDPLVEDVSLLQRFGVNALEETFAVNTDGNKMTLQSSVVRLNFRRF